MSVNKVILLGHVGKDPDVRYLAQNQPMATFSLATTDRAFTNANGVQVPERTEWHNIVMWGRNAEVAERYIRKGTQLYIEGRLRTRAWEDRNQIKRYVTEIYVDTFELLGRPRTEQNAAQPFPQEPAAPQQPTPPQQTQM
ncbi:MAG: single-stranded DNA-binding protein [Muribaculaceae bacterium]|nr:single-stranded DNA-binding protein [Muribaculaceae bacterium]